MFNSNSSRFVKGRKPNRKPAKRGARPTVENLELRIVPSTIPRPDHVVVVMEENHAYGQIIGNSAASYINNTLVPEGALMTNSFGITHPSLPNYLDIFSGSNQGITGDVFPIPGACRRSAAPPAIAPTLMTTTTLPGTVLRIFHPSSSIPSRATGPQTIANCRPCRSSPPIC